jgi:hypothetical protein
MSDGPDLFRSTPQPPDGTAHVELPAFKKTQVLAPQAAEAGAVAGFFGQPGTGKTYALDHYVRHSPLPHVWITAAPQPTKKEIFEELIFQLEGVEAKGSARQLRRDCQQLLATERRVIVVDEAQYLSTLWLQQLRTLHDDGRGRWALFLVGGVGTGDTIDRHPELGSRLSYKVEFEPLSDDQLLAALNAYHPVFANTPDDILLRIDDRPGFGGNFRGWTTFLRNALPLLAKTDTPERLSTNVVKAVFATMGIR